MQIIEYYCQNAYSVKKVHRALLPFYGQFNRSTEAAIRTKFRTKSTLLEPTRLRRVRTKENIAAVSASVNEPSLIDSSPFAAIGRPLLLNNIDNFAEGFWCVAFQNTAGTRIESKGLPQRRIFVEWALGKSKIHFFIEKLCSATKLIFWLNVYNIPKKKKLFGPIFKDALHAAKSINHTFL